MANLLEDWTTHGPAVLAKVREQDPSTYLRVAFITIPKDVQIAIEQRSGPMDSNEMRNVRRLVDLIEACGANTGDPEQVWSWVEEDLRTRRATPIEQELNSRALQSDPGLSHGEIGQNGQGICLSADLIRGKYRRG